MEIESLMASNSRMCKHFGTKTHRDGFYTYMSYSEEIRGFCVTFRLFLCLLKMSNLQRKMPL